MKTPWIYGGEGFSSLSSPKASLVCFSETEDYDEI